MRPLMFGSPDAEMIAEAYNNRAGVKGLSLGDRKVKQRPSCRNRNIGP